MNWEEMVKNFKELSEDKFKLENLIEEEMMAVIKETHPDDYQNFIEENKAALEQMKLRIKERFLKEVCPRISNLLLISPATR